MQNDLSGRIRRLREAAGLSQAELALEARLLSGRQLVCAWEAGGQPNARFIAQVANALKVSSHYLLTGEESEFAQLSDTACG